MGGKDANDVLLAEGEDTVRRCVDNVYEQMPVGVATIDDEVEAFRELVDNGVPRFPGIKLHGFAHLVRFEPGRLMVISGFPGAGKSSFADYLMMSLAVQQGWKAAVYSPEKYPMSLHYYELGQILMGREMSVKNFTAQALDRGFRFLRDNIFHISEENNSIEDILASATQLVRKKGIRVLLIDPFNYIELPVLSGANDTQKISYVLKRMVDFGHKEKVLVILVAHPKKPQTEGKVAQQPQLPSLYDIAGSADFYNKCDYGLILQRERRDEYTKGAPLTWIHVLKIRFRHLGQIGKRAFGFDTTCGRFVGTEDNSLTLLDRDHNDWSYREAEQQQIDFDAEQPADDSSDWQDGMPF
jgi:twinkle protein